jgi:two-component system, NtrC family, response regulator AtoC
MPDSILIVEDDRDMADLIREALRRRKLDARVASSAQACLDELRVRPAALVITDVKMEGMSGIELCEVLHRDHPDVLSIVITGAAGLETAVAAIRAGAYDYITKPVKLDVLVIAVERAMQHLSIQRELRRLRVEVSGAAPPDAIVGSSPAIRATVEMVARVAKSDATVLITGESGTGKELVARALHNQSGRAAQPFIAINCAAMPAPLLESELFGHVRGAFTDAKQARSGLFVQAGAGTIFLDEIGEMAMEMQVKLLRVLQERRVRPVGGDDEVAIKARVITATNRDLEIEVEEKRFRGDLFYRINVVPIAVPPLRERADDVLLLAQHFVRRIAKQSGKSVEGISAPAARLLLDYDWPGNVRELENCIERAVALSRFTEITIDALPPKVVEHGAGKLMIATASPSELVTVDEMLCRYVRQVMTAVGGNKTHAARILGIDRRSLYRRLKGEQGKPKEPDPTDPA